MKRPAVHQYSPYQPPPTKAAIKPAASASWRKLFRLSPFPAGVTIAGAETCRSAGSDPGRSAGGVLSKTSATAVVLMITPMLLVWLLSSVGVNQRLRAEFVVVTRGRNGVG